MIINVIKNKKPHRSEANCYDNLLRNFHEESILVIDVVND